MRWLAGRLALAVPEKTGPALVRAATLRAARTAGHARLAPLINPASLLRPVPNRVASDGKGRESGRNRRRPLLEAFMCDHCGCREITPIHRLMAEHERLLDLAGQMRGAVRGGDTAAAHAILAELTGLLYPHVQAEERGLFAVLRERGEFKDHIDLLEAEHAELRAKLDGPVSAQTVLEVCDALREHIHLEEYGLFPFALADLGGDDWAAVSDREASAR